MPVRDLLVVTLGEDARMGTPTSLSSSWNVLEVTELGGAHKALRGKPYPVGVLLLKDTRESEVAAIDLFLEAHQATQWVGVFPSDVLKRTAFRRLIVQHLFDFHTWPIDPSRLNHTLGHAYGYAELSTPTEAQAASQRNVGDMELVGHSLAIQHLRKQITKVAQANATVLIWGESGSGKELTARAIHNRSPRSAGPFVAMNCGAVPASLIQSELFGYERGAFTGATKEKRGLIESAAGGTLFLDEVGDLPLELQTNLLRFLQEHTIIRVGSARSIEVDVRVIAASHMRLEDAVRTGRFREDLLYRLNVLPLAVPALRERKEDLEVLAQHFFKLFGSDKNPRLTGFSNRAILAMQQHDWPGNVRELINRIRRAMVMSEGRLIMAEDLDLQSLPVTGIGEALEEARVRAECDAIQESLQGSRNNKTRAARDLGVSRMTLYRLMEKHGIHL
jgi:DNA-binding NtrC family response regulator